MYKINLHVFLILVSIWLRVKSAEFAPEQKNSRLKRNFKLNNLIVTNQVNTRTVDDCKTACSHAIGCIGFDYCHTPLPAICFTHVFNGYLLYNPDTDLEVDSTCSFYKKEESPYLVANGLSVLIKSAFVKRRLLTIPPSSAPLATNSLQQTLKSDDPRQGDCGVVNQLESCQNVGCLTRLPNDTNATYWPGTEDCKTGNLAFNKTANQSTQLYPHSPASAAVDGVLANNDDDISHTKAANDSWWMVDLKYLSNITNVVVYNRISASYRRLSNFTVRVGNCSDIATHSLCTYFEDVVPRASFSVISCNQHMLGRFVSIQVTEHSHRIGTEKAPFLVLREVVVVGHVICIDEIGPSTQEADIVTRTEEHSDNNSSTPSGVRGVADDSDVHRSRKVMTIIAVSLLSVMLIMAAIKAFLCWYVDELNIFGRAVGAQQLSQQTSNQSSFVQSTDLSEYDNISNVILPPAKEAEAVQFTTTMQQFILMSLANKGNTDSPESSGTPESAGTDITQVSSRSDHSYTSLESVKKVKECRNSAGTLSLNRVKSNKSKSQKSKNKNANALIVDNTLKSEDVTNYRCINNGNTLALAKNTDNPSDGGSSALVKNNFNKINYLYTDKYRTLANINSNYGVNDVILLYSNKGCSVNPGRFRRLVSGSETNPIERQFSRYYSNKDIPAGRLLKGNVNVRNSTNSNSGLVEGESKASSNCSQLHKVRVGPVVCTVNGGGQESTNSESKNQCSNLTHLHNIPSNITGKQCGKFFITNSEGTKGTDVDCIYTVLHNVNRQFTTENNGGMLVNRTGKVVRKYRYRTTTEADERSLDSHTKTVHRRNVTIAVQPIVTKSHHCDQLLHSNDCSAVDGNNPCQNASDTANTVDFGIHDFSRIGLNVDELSRDTEIQSNTKYN